jgi:hypothetical protein
VKLLQLHRHRTNTGELMRVHIPVSEHPDDRSVEMRDGSGLTTAQVIPQRHASPTAAVGPTSLSLSGSYAQHHAPPCLSQPPLDCSASCLFCALCLPSHLDSLRVLVATLPEAPFSVQACKLTSVSLDSTNRPQLQYSALAPPWRSKASSRSSWP